MKSSLSAHSQNKQAFTFISRSWKWRTKVLGDSENMFQDKLEFFDIIKVALKVPLQNGTFTMFALVTSFPFLSFLVFYEIVLQQTLHEAFTIPYQGHYTSWSTEDWPQPFSSTTMLSKILIPKLIKLLFLYLVPYHVLEFLSVTVVVDSASRLLGGETGRSTNLRNMIRRSIKEPMLQGPFVTSVYVRLLSTSLLVGLIWIVANYLILSRGSAFVYDYSYYGYYYHQRSIGNYLLSFVILVLHGAAFVGLLVKFMEWSGGWNMSFVISVLEEESFGSEAFEASAYYIRGSKWRGAQLMLVFFAWECLLRLPCNIGGCYRSKAGLVLTFVSAILICAENVVKWLVCLVYYLDCKKRVLEKKVDVEIGTRPKDTTLED